MKPRTRAFAVHDNVIPLIECERNGQRSSVFPGGGPHAGDSFAKATKQEVFGETGLAVETSGPVAENVSRGVPNILAPARMTGSSLATGTGRELTSRPDSRSGSYRPVWIRVAGMEHQPVVPRSVAALVPTVVEQAPDADRGR